MRIAIFPDQPLDPDRIFFPIRHPFDIARHFFPIRHPDRHFFRSAIHQFFPISHPRHFAKKTKALAWNADPTHVVILGMYFPENRRTC